MCDGLFGPHMCAVLSGRLVMLFYFWVKGSVTDRLVVNWPAITVMVQLSGTVVSLWALLFTFACHADVLQKCVGCASWDRHDHRSGARDLQGDSVWRGPCKAGRESCLLVYPILSELVSGLTTARTFALILFL